MDRPRRLASSRSYTSRALRGAWVLPAVLVSAMGCQSSRYQTCCDGDYRLCESAPLPHSAVEHSSPLPPDAVTPPAPVPHGEAPPPPEPMPEPMPGSTVPDEAPAGDAPNAVPAPATEGATAAEQIGFRTVPKPAAVVTEPIEETVVEPIDPDRLPVISEPFPPAPVEPE